MKKAVTRHYNRISMTIGILLVVLLFTTFTVMAYSVFQSVGDELYAERSKNLNEVSEQIAKTVNSICSYSWDVRMRPLLTCLQLR